MTILLWIYLLAGGVAKENSQEELRTHRAGVGTSCQASSFFRGFLHPGCPQQPWEAQTLLSCLLLSRLISAGSTLLFFLLPWWAVLPSWALSQKWEAGWEWHGMEEFQRESWKLRTGGGRGQGASPGLARPGGRSQGGDELAFSVSVALPLFRW